MGRSAANPLDSSALAGNAWIKAIDSACIGMAIISSDGSILQINSAFSNLLGSEPSTLQNTRLWDWLLPRERKDSLLGLIEGQVELKESVNTTVTCLNIQGHEVRLKWTISDCWISEGVCGLLVQASRCSSQADRQQQRAPHIDVDHRVRYQLRAHVSVQGIQGRSLCTTTSYYDYLDEYLEISHSLNLSYYNSIHWQWGDSIGSFDQIASKAGESRANQELLLCVDRGITTFLIDTPNSALEEDEQRVVSISCEAVHLKEANVELAKSEEQFRLLAENSGDVVFLLDLDGQVRWVSPSLTTALGWLPEDWIGKKGMDFMLRNGEDSIYQSNRQQMSAGAKAVHTRDEVMARDGTVHWIETHASPFYNSSGCIEGCVGHFHMVDDLVATESQLRKSEERYRLLAENARDVIWTLEPCGKISYISPSILELRGFTPEEASVQPWDQIHPPESLARSQAYFTKLISDLEDGRQPEPFRSELEYYCKDGSTIWTDVIALPVLDAAGNLVNLLGTSRDITERKRYELKLTLMNLRLHALATTDDLTRIYNRRQLESFIKAAIVRSDRYGELVSLILCDIDSFKAVNDHHGHQTGDNVLIEFCRHITTNLRSGDELARWGGEEFMLLLSHTSSNAAEQVAQKLCSCIANVPFPITGTVTASFGVAQRAPGEVLSSWIQRVDEALYASKEAGKNRVTLAL